MTSLEGVAPSRQGRTHDPQRQLRPPAHLALPVPARDIASTSLPVTG